MRWFRFVEMIAVFSVALGLCNDMNIHARIGQKDSSNQGTFIDLRDGKTYHWVKIGKQIWMAENLNYGRQHLTHPREKDPSFREKGFLLDGEKYCYAEDSQNCNRYGGLYTFYVAVNACPEGWRLPSYEDWVELEGVASSTSYPLDAETKKDTIKGEWILGVSPKYDQLGFYARPAGYRRWKPYPSDMYKPSAQAFYDYQGTQTLWWTSTITHNIDYGVYSVEPWCVNLGLSSSDHLSASRCIPVDGYSIRCVKE